MGARRIYLSPPDITAAEKALALDALDSGWVAPLGPHVDAFEAELAEYSGTEHAVALSSGTAALHLGLLALGVGPGDDVLVPTLTFGATAFAVTYTGARPVFVDSERTSWNIDPDLVAEYLATARRLPKAVIPVDLFGRTADYDRLLPTCEEYGVPVLVDAAEALGARHRGRPAGSMGRAAIFSFNGNKIITTSGGGMLVTNDRAMAHRVRYLSTQARSDAPWYEHEAIGFNSRMSNVLAAIGRGQLRRLPDIIERRRQIQQRYADGLGDLADVAGDPPWGRSNAWLTTGFLYSGSPDDVIAALAARNIEARHVWKPMHLQPVFADAPVIGGAVAESTFAQGICLPSGQRMTDAEVDEVIGTVREALGAPVDMRDLSVEPA
jgi:dTDP-4-amino-4,6-dideoxygalactose transaminase